MSEKTPEVVAPAPQETNVQAQLTAQAATIADLKKQIGELTLKAAQAKGISLKENTAAVRPVIPAENVKLNGKEYKWKVAAFRLSGESSAYTAEEAATSPEIIKKILAVKGQNILQELV
jgi:hypothetical protein